jgi:tetratricopeptide (TPR) repeat protein
VDVEAVVLRAQLLGDVGQWQAAADLLSSALAEHPHEGQLLEAFAVAAYNVGDLDRARGAADAAIAQHGTSLLALQVLARVSLSVSRAADAARYARRAVEANPHDADAHMLLATCLAEVPDRRAAMTALDRALELESHDPELFLAAARVARRFGDDRAAQFIATGLDLDPSNADLQTEAASARPFAGERVAGLSAVLVDEPTHGPARHTLAQTVWGTIARLASGVWIYTLAVVLFSAWVPPSALRHLAPMLMAPLLLHWIRTFFRVRQQLPRGYLARRLRRSPVALAGIGLAAFAAIIATMAPALITVGWSPDGVRLGYDALIVACLLAGIAHVMVTMGRLRSDRDVSVGDHLAEQSGYWLVWLLGLGLPVGLGWACYRLAAQPGALWFALMVLPIVFGVRCMEYVVALAGRGLRWSGFVVAALFLVGCAWLVLWCGHQAASVDFKYQPGPLSPGNIQVPTFSPLPPIPTFTAPTVPSR